MSFELCKPWISSPLQIIFAPPGENDLQKKESTMLPQAITAFV
jgi:hypothetical protein